MALSAPVVDRAVGLARGARRPLMLRRRRGLEVADRRTGALALAALASTAGVIAAEVGRVWRRGSAPMPAEADDLLLAAEEAIGETVSVAVAGYRQGSDRENAAFNLFASFVVTFLAARGLAWVLRGRRRVGPFRDVHIGRRHIHHFVPGILLAFASGSIAVASGREELKPKLALAFGAGMGLTLDESALLLELEDVYWTREGVLSVQVTLGVTALMGAIVTAARLLRRGERAVLERAAPGAGGSG
ncbi:MAG: hypothetical protein IRZ21_00750 [Thermoleophilaceae bacterium]|nr:hypothetical protein [Thermoleophilaceae bacterium]